MDKKFELTNETIVHNGRTLHRIRALKDFGDIRAEELGGFIEKEINLSQRGNCWIFDNAKVYDNAEIRDNARVWDDTEIYGNAKIYDQATVYGNAKVYDYAIVRGNAKVYKDAILRYEQRVESGRCTVDLSKNLKENIRCQTDLFPQKDYVIAYKQVRKDLTSFWDSTFQYKIGRWIVAKKPDMSNASCASGLHFSNMKYWDREISGDKVYLMAKIMLDDIITVQRGKIRCKRALILDKYEIED